MNDRGVVSKHHSVFRDSTLETKLTLRQLFIFLQIFLNSYSCRCVTPTQYNRVSSIEFRRYYDKVKKSTTAEKPQ